jgi:hypothetical protein
MRLQVLWRKENPLLPLRQLEGSSKNPRTNLAPKECSVGFHQGSSHSGPGNPTRGQQSSGQDCSSSTPPSGGPSTDDRSRAPATPSSAAHSGPASVPPGNPLPSPPPLVHFLEFAQLESCHLNEVDLGAATPMLRFCLIGYVAGKL